MATQDLNPSNPQTGSTGSRSAPKWWSDEHTQGWDRERDRLRSEWNVGGPSSVATHGTRSATQGNPATGTSGSGPRPASREWTDVEPAMRYGHGAFAQFRSEHPEWTASLSEKLRHEWTDLKSGHTWDDVKEAVRKGWDAARRKG